MNSNKLINDIKRIEFSLNEKVQSDIEELHDELIATYISIIENLETSLDIVDDFPAYKSDPISGETIIIPGNKYPEKYVKNLKVLKGKLELMIDENKTDINKTKNSDTIANHNNIFISHKSSDKEIVDIFVDFLINTGVPHENIFCSSLPGNDVEFHISKEIKKALESSTVYIVFLTSDYYKSAYCLNESGIIWFIDKKTILIGTPEIIPQNMSGFLDNHYILRRLDERTDISHIYDTISQQMGIMNKTTIITVATDKLIKGYLDALKKRNEEIEKHKEVHISFSSLRTDDERIILLYASAVNKLSISMENINTWLRTNELYNFDIENGFELLYAAKIGLYNSSNQTFKFDIEWFRSLNNLSSDEKDELKKTYNNHQKLSSNEFEKMYELDEFTEADEMFFAYIIDKKQFSFGARWVEKIEVENISEWENLNGFSHILSENYSMCLSKFIENKLVYESDWTSHGNAKEYTLNQSLRIHLLSPDFPHLKEVEKVIKANTINEALPF